MHRPANGLPLLSHLHKNYEAQLLTIHPRTLKIRSFVDYDILVEYHGQRASLPSAYTVDPNALQQHYDMCCIENMIASWIPDEPAPLDYKLSMAPPPHVLGLSTGQSSPAAGDTLANSLSGTTTGNPPTSLQPSTSNFTMHPPSPPSSDSGRRWWLCGSEVIEDPQEAQKLRQQGWILSEVYNEDQQRLQQSRRRWIWGDQVIDDPSEATELCKQGWPLEEVRVGSEEEYRLLATMDKSTWICPDLAVIDDPHVAADLLSSGYPLHRVQKRETITGTGTSDKNRGRSRKRRRLTPSPSMDQSMKGHACKYRRLF